MSVYHIFIARDPAEVGDDSDQGEKSDLNGTELGTWWGGVQSCRVCGKQEIGNENNVSFLRSIAAGSVINNKQTPDFHFKLHI